MKKPKFEIGDECYRMIWASEREEEFVEIQKGVVTGFAGKGGGILCVTVGSATIKSRKFYRTKEEAVTEILAWALHRYFRHDGAEDKAHMVLEVTKIIAVFNGEPSRPSTRMDLLEGRIKKLEESLICEEIK